MILKDIIKANSDMIIKHSRIFSDMQLHHTGMEGEAREFLVKDLLMPYLPGNYKICSGKLLDYDGKLSPQIDIIIYNTFEAPAMPLSGNNFIVPIGACHFVIEVKTTLTAQAIKQSLQSAQTIGGLKRHATGDVRMYQTWTMLFAFNSDIKNNEDINRIKKYDNKYQKGFNPAIYTLCVVKNDEYQTRDGKQYIKAPIGFAVTQFIVHIMNTLISLPIKNTHNTLGKYL